MQAFAIFRLDFADHKMKAQPLRKVGRGKNGGTFAMLPARCARCQMDSDISGVKVDVTLAVFGGLPALPSVIAGHYFLTRTCLQLGRPLSERRTSWLSAYAKTALPFISGEIEVGIALDFVFLAAIHVF